MLSAAGRTPSPQAAKASATRRAAAGETASTAKPSPSIRRAISPPTPRHPATIGASAAVPAEIASASAPSSAAAISSASGSPRSSAISAEVSTAITRSGSPRQAVLVG